MSLTTYTSNNTLRCELTGWLHTAHGKQPVASKQQLRRKREGQRTLDMNGRWSVDGYTRRQDPRPSTEESQQPPSAGLLWRSETRFRIILATCLVYQKAQGRNSVIIPQHWWGAHPLDTASSRSPLGSAWAQQPPPWHSSGLNCQSRPAPGRALWITLPPELTSLWGLKRLPGKGTQKESMLWRLMKSGLTHDS